MAKISPMFALEAEELFENGNHQDAIELCKNGIELYPEYLTGYLTLIDLYLKISDYQSAGNIIQKVKDSFPYNKQIYHYEKILYDSLENQSDYDQNFSRIGEALSNKHLEVSKDEKIISEKDDLPTNFHRNLGDFNKNAQEYDTEKIASIPEITENIQNDEFIIQDKEEYLLAEHIVTEEPLADSSVEILPTGFLKYYAAQNKPEFHKTSIKASDKFIIDGLFDYVFFDYSKSNISKFELNAAFDIEHLASKYQPIEAQEDDLTKLAEKITNISKISPIEPADDSPNEEEPVNYTPPATETMAKILIQQGKLDKAVKIYLKLAESNPEKRDYFLLQADEIKKSIEQK